MSNRLVRKAFGLIIRTNPDSQSELLVLELKSVGYEFYRLPGGNIEANETPLQAESEARIIARVCKRAAVKAGQTLTLEEQTRLIRDLEACQSPRTCPHGRPTMIHLSVDLLERQFGRRGAR